MNRYARQIALSQVGPSGQARLRDAHVLVAGAGGLGMPVLQYLVGAGVGTITLIDGDCVAITNLHRQPLYRMSDVGRPKVDAAAQAMKALNPEVTLHAICEWLTPQNAPLLVAQADLIIDCADTFAASFTLSDAAHPLGKPLISASALGLSGYVGGFCGPAPSLRAVFPDLPSSAATCETAGVLGPVVAIIGATQAQMALAVLLEFSPSPLGQMMIVDTANWRMSGFRFDGAPEPASPAPFIAQSQIRPEDFVIDLRTEAALPFSAAALHLSSRSLHDLELPTPDTRIVLACRTGLRAHHAAADLRKRWAGDIALLAVTEI
ncbi:HesA/MoeB/ThiF family protein [Sulfitobacter guttiformis]|uniref:Molybdopterin/thiamine biosynthesis adenylyltransferase n=1 Tax=Sulfitobacter guttiformis TaxID=74349 RepID=A0A420DQT5_9RHOB|nr:HesA/MoeB/ThiF family protein [Sulfitobacter guttiformis]KIN73908.1 MoeZ/MoeB domain family [Sulfitobacter guttiformis KCTC 32187]RKE96540.1 molybdopterin/thiamine biosynthesis adenylyltransferase [Sulfitobacter guttiformis]